MCEDKAAPAPARATAAGLLLRAAALGGFGKQAERSRDLEPHEMNGEQFQAALADLQREREKHLRRRQEADDADGDGDVFD